MQHFLDELKEAGIEATFRCKEGTI
jgi:hypothetical protein